MKTTPEHIKNEVVRLYAIQKKTIYFIADTTGLSRRSVGRILVDAGLKDEPIKTSKQIMRVLQAYGLTDVDKLHVALAFLAQDKHNVVRDYVVGLDEATYQKFLADVIHKREAKRYNSSVSNAMLQLSKRANNNGSSN